jgi:hypothetical protein
LEYAVHEFSSNEAITIATIWLVGSMAALARTLRDSDSRNYWSAFGAVSCGGFLAVSFCGIASAHIGGYFASGGYSIAVASLVGLMGKSLDSLCRTLVSLVLKIKLPAISELKDDE